MFQPYKGIYAYICCGYAQIRKVITSGDDFNLHAQIKICSNHIREYVIEYSAPVKNATTEKQATVTFLRFNHPGEMSAFMPILSEVSIVFKFDTAYSD